MSRLVPKLRFKEFSGSGRRKIGSFKFIMETPKTIKNIEWRISYIARKLINM
ncbi:Type I restriction-modification system, specificity subunit S (EC [uncultured Gammaproteobacteria bacterium]|nr:Type I restriction-modification system, specificity subunit S (EC [uncultured Gammaproteobacteria bacterium]